MSALSDLQKWLDDARARHNVVGASIAVLHGGDIHAAASGLLNLNTKAAATIASPFQIGSITKVFTAALTMQLVDATRLDLDAPVRAVLPELSEAAPDSVKAMTVRHLLSHTAGLEDAGPPFDPAIATSLATYLVAKLNPPPCFVAPGVLHSYSNNGFAIAGRISEVLMDGDWPSLVMDRICRPLGLASAGADPAKADAARGAVGHMGSLTDPNVPLGVLSQEPVPLCMAPAGSTLAMSASDLVRAVTSFDEIASPQALAEMQAPQVALHPYSPRHTTHWGLGWSLVDHPRHTILAHDGSTPGQAAYLRMIPDAKLAIALLTNSPSIGLWDEMLPTLLRELTGIELPAHPPARALAVSPTRYTGWYGAGDGRVVVSEKGAQLYAAIFDKPGGTMIFDADLLPFDTDAFEARSVTIPGLGDISFLGSDEKGRARYLSWGFRAVPRRPDGERM